MRLGGAVFQRLDDPAQTCSAADLAGMKLAGIAGIAVPQRFFAHLERLGLQFSRHVFPDHHGFVAEDFAAIDADALLMTEKDAVKCGGLSQRPAWVLPVTAQVDALPSHAAAGLVGLMGLMGLVALVEQCIVDSVEKPLGRPTA